MRQARPDDVFSFVTVDEIVDLWSELERYLGREQPFWRWLLEYWGCELSELQSRVLSTPRRWSHRGR